MASLALGVAGAAVGFYLGGGPTGAAIGWSLGSAAGSALDPPKTQGPRLTDLKVQSSQYGGMIPIVYGTDRLTGQVCWAVDKVEHQHKSGGKGGPQQTNYTYTQSWATRLCEGPDKVITRAWANGRLVYDPANGLEDMTFTQYPGSESQLPDPTMEAHLGSVNGMLGICYVVHADQDLTDFGMMMPNMSYEVSTQSIVDCPVASIRVASCVPPSPDSNWYTNGVGPYPVIQSWDDPAGSPTILAMPNDFVSTNVWAQSSVTYYPGPQYTITIDGVPTTLATWVGGNDRSLIVADSYDFALGWGPTPFVTVAAGACPGGLSVDLGQFSGIFTPRKSYMLAAGHHLPSSASPGECIAVPPTGLNLGNTSGITIGRYIKALVGTPDTRRLFVLTAPVSSAGSVIDEWWELIEGTVTRHGTCDPPLDQNVISFSHFGYPHYSPGYVANMAENNGQYIWAVQLESVRCFKIDADLNLAQICTTKTMTNASTFAQYSCWTFDGGKYGVVANTHLEVFQRYTDGNFTAVTYGTVVADVSERVGLVAAEYDVSELTESLHGYTIAQRMLGRNVVEGLMPYGVFDAMESDGKVKFPKRGGASVMTIDVADLGAHAEGNEPPAKIRRTRGIDTALPSEVAVVFSDIDADYQNGTQLSLRQVGHSLNPITMTTSIAMTNAKAKQVADANMATAWYGRNKGTIALPPKYAVLDPTDIITLQGRTERIEAKNTSARGPIVLDITPDLAALWFQHAVPAAGVGFIPPVATPPQTSDLLLLDIPYITDPQRQQVYYAAMAGADRTTWAGAALFKSIDAGASYQQIATDIGPPDTFGVTTTALGDYTDGCLFDETNSVTVLLTPGSGQLESVGRTAVLNGAGLFAIGSEANGYEIIAAKFCSLTGERTYVLSGLLRGLRGTEWAISTHLVGDNVVALPVTTTLDAIWGEYGALRKYQAVTAGSALPVSGGSAGDFDSVITMDLDWDSPVRIYSSSFGPNDALVIRFTTGSVASPSSYMPAVVAAEWGTPTQSRYAVLSATACDFSNQTYLGAVSSGTSITSIFTVENTDNFGYYPILLTDTTYYLNIKNIAPISGSGPFDMFIELQKPSGI